MTGKELIIYILENNLEDVELLPKEYVTKKLPDKVSIEEVAAMSNLGTETINVWCDLGYLDKIEYQGRKYVIRNGKFNSFVKCREVFCKG